MKRRPLSAQPQRPARSVTPVRNTITVAHSLPKKKKSGKPNHNYGDIIGNNTNSETKQRTQKKLSEKFSATKESLDLREKNHIISPKNMRASSSDSGNIITTPPLEQELSMFRKRPSTFQLPSAKENNILHYDSDRKDVHHRPSRPQRYTSALDLLSFENVTRPDFVVKRPQSPMRVRENERNILNMPAQSNAPLMPAVRYTQTTNKTIQVPHHNVRQSMTRSSSMSQILNWGL